MKRLLLVFIIVVSGCGLFGSDEPAGPTPLRLEVDGGQGGYMVTSKEYDGTRLPSEREADTTVSAAGGGTWTYTLPRDSVLFAWAEATTIGQDLLVTISKEDGSEVASASTSSGPRIVVRVDGGSLRTRRWVPQGPS